MAIVFTVFFAKKPYVLHWVAMKNSIENFKIKLDSIQLFCLCKKKFWVSLNYKFFIEFFGCKILKNC